MSGGARAGAAEPAELGPVGRAVALPSGLASGRRLSAGIASPRGIAAALLGAGLFTALLAVGDRLLADPDTHWHVAVGRRIWQDGAVPWTDGYSHTFAGAPWLAKEWGSQLLLAAIDGLAGTTGLVVATAATLAATFALLFTWLAKRLRASAAIATTLASVTLVAPHFLARPHVFGLVLLLVWTIGVVEAAEEKRAPSPWLLVVLILWANLHGSVTIAYPLAGLAGLDALLTSSRAERPRLFLGWALFGLGALAAGLVTPYGIGAILVTATLFGSGESLPFIREWQPIGLSAVDAVAVASVAALGVGLAFEPRRNAFRLVGLAALAFMFARHARFLDVYALAAPILAAGPLARRFAFLRPEPEPDPTPDGAGRLRAALPFAALAILAAASLGLALGGQYRPDPAVTPDAALAAARAAGVEGPVYNDYDFGGFLIARGVPTFIDGRTDQLFLGGFMTGLFKALWAEEDGPFLALLDRHRVTWALVRPDSQGARHLASQPGWTRLHADDVAVVFRRT